MSICFYWVNLGSFQFLYSYYMRLVIKSSKGVAFSLTSIACKISRQFHISKVPRLHVPCMFDVFFCQNIKLKYLGHTSTILSSLFLVIISFNSKSLKHAKIIQYQDISHQQNFLIMIIYIIDLVHVNIEYLDQQRLIIYVPL